MNKGEIWVTSDTHFNHRFMAELRGYQGVDAMNEAMTNHWNAVVGPRDTVYHLGDFAFGDKEEIAESFYALNGNIILYKGNHDGNGVLEMPFEDVREMGKLNWNGNKFWLCHYPMLTWPNAHHGVLHLHGHTHGNLLESNTTRMDVGPDATGKLMLHISQIPPMMAHLQYDFVDHHGPESYKYGS